MMADPFAGFSDKGPQAPAPQADPWAGWRDAGPEGTPSAQIADTFADLKGAPNAPTPKGFYERLSEGEFPTLYNPKTKLFPGRTGKPPRTMGLDLPTFAEGMGEAPGVTLAGAVGLAPLRSMVAKSAAVAANHLPATALAATAGWVASHLDDQPDWVKEFAHNFLLHVQLTGGGKK